MAFPVPVLCVLPQGADNGNAATVPRLWLRAGQWLRAEERNLPSLPSRERARELKAEAAKADGETELLAAIAKMQEPDRAMAK